MSNSSGNTGQAQRRWVIMGVSGCGKSEIGQRLARALEAPFLEGDNFHTLTNIAKMSAGVALTDADRADWLKALREQIAAAAAKGTGLVLSCSALKRRYRDLLRGGDPQLRFIHLDGDRDIIAARLAGRVGHYMPSSLLDSQLRDLEPLQPDENGLRLDLRLEPDQLVAEILDKA